MKVRSAVAGVAVLGLALTACGEPKEVSGVFDETKYKAGKPAVQEKSHMVTKTRNKTTTTCTRRVKGICKSSVTTTKPETYTEKVIDRPYKPAKPAKYCVELDKVNGENDVWFNVSMETWNSLADKAEGFKVKKMKYNHKGC